MGGIPAAAGCQPVLNSWLLTGFAPVGAQKQPVASKGSGLFGQAPNKKGPPIILTGLLVVERAALGAAARHPRLAPAAPSPPPAEPGVRFCSTMPTIRMKIILWYRNDLRTHDHEALWEAAQ
ncbi:hypothetical protein GCM10011495_39350 [Hymenobacter frigidus]|uniref:Photolyase/cryptochrome alpha/beta domain-containing protein n=1 Tax=Hymenobacter frigidus TaxID=1524095 RepID=A0ABQ2AKA5_9BACT|nr:hypothetical protein GCM10011495_39350 [Hymenobacter frigidus]